MAKKKRNIVPDSFRKLGDVPFELPEALRSRVADTSLEGVDASGSPPGDRGGVGGGITPVSGSSAFSSPLQLPEAQVFSEPQSEIVPESLLGPIPGGGSSSEGFDIGGFGTGGGIGSVIGGGAGGPVGAVIGRGIGGAFGGLGGFGGGGIHHRAETVSPALRIPEQLQNRLSPEHFGALGAISFSQGGPLLNAGDRDVDNVVNELNNRLTKFFGEGNPISQELVGLQSLPGGSNGVARRQRQEAILQGVVNAEEVLNSQIAGIQGDPDRAEAFAASRGGRTIDDFADEFGRQVDIFEGGLGDRILRHELSNNSLFGIGDAGRVNSPFFSEQGLEGPSFDGKRFFFENAFGEDQLLTADEARNLGVDGGSLDQILSSPSDLTSGGSRFSTGSLIQNPFFGRSFQFPKSTPLVSGTAATEAERLRGDTEGDFTDFNDNAFSNLSFLNTADILSQGVESNRAASIFNELPDAPGGFFNFDEF